MALELPNEPSSGPPNLVEWLSKMQRYVRGITPSSSADILVHQGTGGVTLSLARKFPLQDSDASFPFKLVPALDVPDFIGSDDDSGDEAENLRTFYLAYGHINGVRVKGTLNQDGTLCKDDGMKSKPLVRPQDSKKFVVFVKGAVYWALVSYLYYAWWKHSQEVGHFDDKWPYSCDAWPSWEKQILVSLYDKFVDDENELTHPEVFYGEVRDEKGIEDTWETYPCQPHIIVGPVANPDQEDKCLQFPCWARQPFCLPIALSTPDEDEDDGYKTEQLITTHLVERMQFAFWFWTYYYVEQEDSYTNPLVPYFYPSHFAEEHDYKDLSCDPPFPDFSLCDSWFGFNKESPLNGGGNNSQVKAQIDDVMRQIGNWLYRVYHPANATNERVIAMQDGLFWDGGINPQVVEWGGAVLDGSETEDYPFQVALKIDFNGIANPLGGYSFTHSIASGKDLNIEPVIQTLTVTPDGWPEGYTITEINTGVLYLPIADVYFEDGKMVIKEKHRGHATFELALVSGGDGVTGEAAASCPPMHQISLLAGRRMQEISGLLESNAFSTRECVIDTQITAGEATPPAVLYKLQKKIQTLYLYRGFVVYTDEGEWVDCGGTIGGWEC